MLEPIYGSIFIKERFLEYSLVSVGVGVVLAMIYTFFAGSDSGVKTSAPEAGLHKDEKLRKGIIVSLDVCALVLASSFFTTHAMFKHSGEFGPWRGPHLTQLFLAYPVLGLLGFTNTLACVLRSHEHVHVRTWVSCVLIQVGSILGLTLVVFQMAPQGPSCPRVYISAILIAVISGLHKSMYVIWINDIVLSYQDIIFSRLSIVLQLLVLTFIHGEVALPDERLESRKPKTAFSRASLAMSFIPLVLVLTMAAQTATRNPQCQAGVTKVKAILEHLDFISMDQ